MEKLRICSNKNEIIGFINESIFLKANLLVWQNIGGVRRIFKGRFSKIDFKKNTIKMRLANSKKIDVDGMATLYVRGTHMSILFKQEIVDYSFDHIEVAIPNEVRLHEFRELTRKEFIYHFAPYVNFYIESNYGIEKKYFKTRLLDITNKGMAVMLTSSRYTKFQPGDPVYIENIGLETFTYPIEPLEGLVVYLRPAKIIDEGKELMAYRIGIRFPISLDDLQLKGIK